MKGIHTVSFILLIIGGLNWLLTAFGWNIVEKFVGGTGIDTVIYVLVGLAAIAEVINHKKLCRNCSTKDGMASSSM